ncbi:MAG: glycosyltransferase family 2 protein [Planctomycetaceae bacterium]|nr:glycosyltransferase family 2 protein [Planctomycetaceae bacterium]
MRKDAPTESASAPELSLVIACYREEGHLRESVREIVATLQRAGITHELIFIEDYSPDGTAAIVRELVAELPQARAVYHAHNVGRGGTVSEGFRLARGRCVGFLDVDLEVHCRHIPSMLDALRAGADGATAYREYAVGLSWNGFVRHMLSQGYRWVVGLFLRLPFRDTETGFKFFVRERILPVLDLTQDRGWFWDTEIMVLAHRAGLRVTEIPCPFVRRGDKPSTVRVFRDTWRYLVALQAFRRRLRSERRAQSAAAASQRSNRAASARGE